MTKVELLKKLNEKLESGEIDINEAEQEYQDFVNRGENIRGW